MQAFGRVSRQDRHFTLSDDFTVIDFLVHIMNSATAYLLAGCERLFPRFESGKFWEKRWMDIDDAPREFPPRNLLRSPPRCSAVAAGIADAPGSAPLPPRAVPRNGV